MKPTFAREKQKLKMADKVYYTLSVTALLSSILVYTYPSINTVQKSRLEQKIRAEMEEELEQQNRLVLGYETLTAPQRMEKIAVRNGFIRPKNGQTVYVIKKK